MASILNEAIIDFAALKHNLNQVKIHAPQSRILAMVKSNGYGHGLTQVAQALQTVDGFGVARIEEAITLRQIGIMKPITVMVGFQDGEDLAAFISHDLEAVIHNSQQLQILATSKLSKPLAVWLKIDTGMNRLGLSMAESFAAYSQLLKSINIKKPIRIMTHFADADKPELTKTKQQLVNFHNCTKDMLGEKSLANSAAILAWPQTHGDWVRPGIMLYGVSPFAADDIDLRPVMTLRSQLIAIKNLRYGEQVGYGSTWTCPEDNMPLGIIGIGYGDGYPRHAKNNTPVLIKDKICRLVGRVSMDMLAVDLRPCRDAKLGEQVILWGKKLPITTIAHHSDTIAYTLFCGLTTRVKFRYEQ